MQCDICGEDPGCVYCVPIAKGQKSISFACRTCALEHGVFCEKHAVQHTGWPGGKTFCSRCIEDAVEVRTSEAENLVTPIFDAVSQEEGARLMEEVELTHWSRHTWSSHMRVLRLVMIHAHRRGIPVEEIVQEVVRHRSITSLLFARS